MDAQLPPSELWAALIGAVVGGGFTLVGSLMSHRWQTAAAARDRRDQFRREAYVEFLRFVYHIGPEGEREPVDSLDPKVAGAQVMAYGSDVIRLPVTAGRYLIETLRWQERPSEYGIVLLRHLWEAVAASILDELGPAPTHKADQENARMHGEWLAKQHRDAIKEVSALRRLEEARRQSQANRDHGRAPTPDAGTPTDQNAPPQA